MEKKIPKIQTVAQGYFTHNCQILLALKQNGSRIWAPIGGHLYQADGSDIVPEDPRAVTLAKVAIEKRFDLLVGKSGCEFYVSSSQLDAAIVERYVGQSSKGNIHNYIVFYGRLLRAPIGIPGQVQVFNLQNLERLKKENSIARSTLERSLRAITQIKDLSARC